MSQALSNLSISLPLSSPRTRNTASTALRNFQFLKRNGMVTRAMAAESRDNLDHLQRTNSNNNSNTKHQSHLKKRAVPPAVSPVGLWDRFPTARTVQQMMDTMERMMDDPLAYSRRPSPVDGNGIGRGRTPWEIKETEKEYKLRFDMPGMTKQDVRVWVEEKMLVVKAEKVANKKKESGGEDEVTEVEDDEGWAAKSYGKYSGRIALPENVEFEKITAEVRDGVLYVSIPKASVNAKVFDISVQ